MTRRITYVYIVSIRVYLIFIHFWSTLSHEIHQLMLYYNFNTRFSISGRKKSKKRKSKFAEALEREKPTFDPNANANFEEYLDEYYKLDYEDVIGDLPCRFKYRKVPANDLGLSVEEVLSAPDRELNAWASLKKTCQYRSEEEEKKDIEEFSKKKGNINLKKKILPSLFAENPEGELEAEQSKKASKGKKRRRKSKAKGGNSDIDLSVIEGKKTSQQPKNKRRKVLGCL